jgi:uncharacterized protein
VGIQIFPRNCRRAALRILSSVLVAYLGLCAFLYARQSRFLFVPNLVVDTTPAEFGCSSFEELSIGPNRLHGWWMPGSSPLTLIYHHGNAGNVGDNSEHACRLNKFGFNVLIFDYRGYGHSKGDFPSEQSVYEDADAAWAFATQEKKMLPRDIVLYGHSLGSAVAIEMATRHPDAAGLIAESGFTSVYDMGKRDPAFNFFPLNVLLHQRMDSISKVPKLKMPALFIHGEADRLIPADMSRTLHAAAPEPKRLLLVPRGGHDNSAAAGGELYKNAVLEFAGSLQTHARAVTAQ